MRTSIDHSVEIDAGLDRIRQELEIPGDFPA